MGAGSLRIPGRSAPADFQCLGIPGKSGSGGRFGPESRVSRDSGAENPGYPAFFSWPATVPSAVGLCAAKTAVNVLRGGGAVPCSPGGNVGGGGVDCGGACPTRRVCMLSQVFGHQKPRLLPPKSQVKVPKIAHRPRF